MSKQVLRVVILLFLSLVILSCKTNDLKKENISKIDKEVLAEAEMALQAHKSFILTVGGQTLSTYINYMNTTLAPDQKFLTRANDTLPTELIFCRDHLKEARQNWLEFFDAWGKNRDPKDIFRKNMQEVQDQGDMELKNLEVEEQIEMSKASTDYNKGKISGLQRAEKELEIVKKFGKLKEEKQQQIIDRLEDLKFILKTKGLSEFDDGYEIKMVQTQELAKNHVEEAEKIIKAYKSMPN